MVGVEGEHSKPLVPAEKGTELRLSPWSQGVGTPKNIHNYKCQKGGGGGSVYNKVREKSSIQGLRSMAKKSQTIQVRTNKYNCLLHKYPRTHPTLQPSPYYLVNASYL